MKYLLIALLFIFGSSTLSAQDTLYVKGKRKPLLVNITIVKENSLNYTKEKGGLIHTVKMKNVKKIKFKKEYEVEPSSQSSQYSKSTEVEAYPEFDEFSSSISLNSIGSFRYYGGLNYLHCLKNIQSENGRNHFFINVGGGIYRRRPLITLGTLEQQNQARGTYLEVGMRMEVSSKQSPKNRFHIGLDINNRWVEKTITRFFDPGGNEVSNVSELAIQVPIGYTFRSPDGFYLVTGLEVTTEKLFPAAHVGVGYAF